MCTRGDLGEVRHPGLISEGGSFEGVESDLFARASN